jgi:SAM-dependent methyltransferase
MSKQQKEDYDRFFVEDKSLSIELPDYKITGDKKLVDRNILVLGVGTGRDVRYLASKNEVWGVDISEKGLNIARKNSIKGLKQDVNKPLKGIPEKYFDIVVAKDILEHLEDPMGLMLQIKKLLKKRGFIVINIPNHFYLPMRLRILFGKNIIWKSFGHDHTILFDEWDYMHKSFFTWKGFNKFLDDAGFKVTKSYLDLGTLGYYDNPEWVEIYIKEKYHSFYLHIYRITMGLFNIFLPVFIRRAIAEISPGLFCGSFYVHAVVKQ